MSDSLTPALEDYLETIYLVLRENKVARVRDIVRARGVKAGSVTPALKRLDELGLIEYEAREYIGLTALGEQAARRIMARHHILADFFNQVLKMPADIANRDACVIEHHLSDLAMDRLVGLFEYIRADAKRAQRFLKGFHQGLDSSGVRQTPAGDQVTCQGTDGQLTLDKVAVGEKVRVSHVLAHGEVRKQLLDMGLIPNAELSIERIDHKKQSILIRLSGFLVGVEQSQARWVVVDR